MASGARFTAKILSKHPKKLILLSTLIISSVIPAIGLVIILALAIQQLQSAPELLAWNEMLGEHVARWIAPYVRDTQFEAGISAEIQISYLPIALAAVGLAHALTKGLIEYIVESLSHEVAREIRNSVMFSHFSMPYPQAIRIDGSLIASLVGPNAHETQLGIRRMAGLVPMNFLQSLILLTWLIILDTKLFALFITVLLPAGIAIRILGRTLKKLARQGISYETEVLALFSERLSGWETIRVFGTLRKELARFAEKNLELYKRLRRSARASSLGAPTVEWLATVAGAFVVLIALRRLSIGELSSAVLTGFLVTIGHLSSSLQGLTRHFNSLKKSRAAIDRISDFLDEANQSTLDRNPEIGPREPFEREPIKEIQVNQIGARPSKSAPNLFSNLSFDATKGDFIAIMGPSGSGKSTLLRCLLGLEELASGSILINQKAVNESRWQRLSKDLAFIAQEPFVLHGTLLENVIFPEESSTLISPKEAEREHLVYKEVEQCLKRAQLSKPVDTMASELSGGEKQRLMLARAFYRRASLWVLDEATSALDKQTEQSFADVLRSASSELIVIFVTHRESVAKYANKCIHLNDYRTNNERNA